MTRIGTSFDQEFAGESIAMIDSNLGLLTTAMLLIVVGAMLIGFAVRGVR
ncbi:hypothetical protein CLV52_0259 [Amnibacterium kyonggiense]|uniref:Uncharacterized protein n=1 Tax=Amnibacterium kyonggiense TaxID=595671 RepID=A0A4R7FQ55_9MICO|nr:hypothetical protein CLV52_0259 [Amnibacterium kyonggiense]